jgi:hypothetical protein
MIQSGVCIAEMPDGGTFPQARRVDVVAVVSPNDFQLDMPGKIL